MKNEIYLLSLSAQSSQNEQENPLSPSVNRSSMNSMNPAKEDLNKSGSDLKDAKPIETIGDKNFKNLLSVFNKKPPSNNNDKKNGSKLDPNKLKNFEKTYDEHGRLKGEYHRKTISPNQADSAEKEKKMLVRKKEVKDQQQLKGSQPFKKETNLCNLSNNMSSIYLGDSTFLSKDHVNFNNSNTFEYSEERNISLEIKDKNLFEKESEPSFSINIFKPKSGTRKSGVLYAKEYQNTSVSIVENQIKINKRSPSHIPSETGDKTSSTNETFKGKTENILLNELGYSKFDDGYLSKGRSENILQIDKTVSGNSNIDNSNLNKGKSENVFDIKKVLSEYNEKNNMVVSQSEFTILKVVPSDNYKDEDEGVEEFGNNEKLVSCRTHIYGPQKEVEVTLKTQAHNRDTIDEEGDEEEEDDEDDIYNADKYNENFDDIDEIQAGERIHRIETACEMTFVTETKVIVIKNKFY